MPFLPPNQQCQSTEGDQTVSKNSLKQKNRKQSQKAVAKTGSMQSFVLT